MTLPVQLCSLNFDSVFDCTIDCVGPGNVTPYGPFKGYISLTSSVRVEQMVGHWLLAIVFSCDWSGLDMFYLFL